MPSLNVAEVVLDIPTRAIDKPYSYSISETDGKVEVGCCVLVDFAGRPACGYVVELRRRDTADRSLKPVLQVLSTPYFSGIAAKEAFWIASQYLCPLSDAVRLFTPPGGTPKVRRAKEGKEPKPKVEIASANSKWELVDASVKPVDERWVSLTESGRDFAAPKAAVKQRAILDALREGPLRVPELSLEIGAVNASIKALEKRGIVRIETRRRIRGASASLPESLPDLKLTSGQQEALRSALAAYRKASGEVVLMDGVTGSGKTEVYLRLIRTVLEEGHDAIVLVPEISLTPQTVGRFRARFNDQVAVLHSGLGLGERFDQWDMCRSGSAHVVVGARSALFAPLHDVKLVVIDEEHDGAYKQDSSPRYHAREVARHMMEESGGTLVLGSATPSLESLHLAEGPKAEKVVLAERTNRLLLPQIHVVDMAREFKSGQRSMFSVLLRKELEATLDQGRKAVLLYNHRGFASYIQCRECGFVPTCEDCSVSLTYHMRGQSGIPQMQCHHCSASYPVPNTCPACGSPYIRKVGKGTEQVHMALEELLGEKAPIIRMDADTTRKKGSHERLLGEFQAAQSAVLLGTQMIAKGLDFPDVTLVGVVNADTILNLPDFRSAERTYQLLEQVSGRSGRSAHPGSVVIQTYWPEHPSIKAVASHDRSIFLKPELATRQEAFYPPFSRLVNILLWGRERLSVQEEAITLGDELAGFVSEHTDGSWRLLGPAPCVLERLKGNWRWHILIKAPTDAALSRILGQFLRSRKPNPAVNSAFDLDPLSLL